MKELIQNFPVQLQEALSISEKFIFSATNIKNVVITGLGGSGIGGTFAQEYVCNIAKVPIIVNKSYELPTFINENTLVIVSSYSGNTEETIRCYHQAIEKKCQIVSITSGGQIKTLSEQNNTSVVLIPPGFPPRTCLGYSFVQVLNILNQSKIISDDWVEEIKDAIQLLKTEQENIKALAENIAKKIFKTIPVIYTLSSEALAIRLRQQLNENSKILCWHHIIPEMNHNELVGWKIINGEHSVLAILTSFDLKENKRRYEICKEIISKFNIPIIEIVAKGRSKLEQWMYVVHLSDWVSYYLSILNNVDAVEVSVIDHLKNELAKMH